ncbi:CbiX/SirB N-terminal domain-containing protein [Ottowia sp. SB7-C50]|uniref:sirohydrochlorin chelatase n=1 Tax=Ottowia sp. SB7-C50 TaxID=3081231 RepID=UPI002952B1DA|nr:CbiX/SirB N-terminal domain-containing protein [Ottowia sp. SB7-C50]WOP14110.1 CbiX/SirB N-terminal domain-containing protein [Ottowia sp. SB7-C50]
MTTATVLFAHGSRDPAWRAPIEAVAARMRELSPGVRVMCAYLEYTSPTLQDAVDALRAAGATSVAIWPMFLGTGRHAREDLPQLVDELRAAHPGVVFTLHPAIAEHADVLQAMASAALGPSPP